MLWSVNSQIEYQSTEMLHEPWIVGTTMYFYCKGSQWQSKAQFSRLTANLVEHHFKKRSANHTILRIISLRKTLKIIFYTVFISTLLFDYEFYLFVLNAAYRLKRLKQEVDCLFT